MILDATIGGVAANSYVTLAEAESYFETRPNSDDWNDGDGDTLIAATRLLDEYDFVGTPASTTQALKWPRVADADDLTELILDKYTGSVIPAPIKNATCEFALWLLGTGGATTETGPIQSLRIGSSVSVTYDTAGATSTVVDSSGFPTAALRQLRGLRVIPVLA